MDWVRWRDQMWRDRWHRQITEEGRCGCLACGCLDGCEGPATEYIQNDEAGLQVCKPCAVEHPREALRRYVEVTA